MISVDVENRSGVEVDEAGAVELAGRVLARGGDRRRASSGSRSSTQDEMRELKREHLGIDESTDVLSFPIDGRDELPEGVPRALGDVVLCPQVVGEEWRWPLDARRCCTCSATTTATRWRRARQELLLMSARRAPTLLDSFNYAFEGIIHVLRTQRNLRIHFAVAFVVLIARADRQRDEARADRAPASRSRSC